MILGRPIAQLSALISAMVKLLVLFNIVSLDESQSIQLIIVVDLALTVLAVQAPSSVPEGTRVNVETPKGEPNRTVTL